MCNRKQGDIEKLLQAGLTVVQGGYQVLINELGVQTDFCLFCGSPTCGTTTRQSWSGWRKS